MAETYSFSHSNYKKLLTDANATGNICDYSDILSNSPEKFIIFRHDVEFSPSRALKLGEIEAEAGVSSSFFFQLTNNSYNTFSAVNITRLRKLHELGHHVGLHFHLQGRTDLDEIASRIQFESELLSHELGISVDRFSFHRPTAQVLAANLRIPGLINAYAPQFFTYIPSLDAQTAPEIKYVADSRNEWSYCEPWQYPNEDFFANNPKVQILCHPYSWSEPGLVTLDNLRSVLEENRLEFIDTMTNETKYVKEYRDEL